MRSSCGPTRRSTSIAIVVASPVRSSPTARRSARSGSQASVSSAPPSRSSSPARSAAARMSDVLPTPASPTTATGPPPASASASTASSASRPIRLTAPTLGRVARDLAAGSDPDVLPHEDHGEPTGADFFVDDQHLADVTRHAVELVQPAALERERVLLDPPHRSVEVLHDLLGTDHEDDLAGTEGDRTELAAG